MTAPGGATNSPDLSSPALVQTPSVDGVWHGAASFGEAPNVLGVRELTAEEVASLPASGNNPGTARLAAQRGQAPARAVERLKTRHHELARLMAAGLTDSEISEGMSVSMSHLHLLRRSPAFQQLLFCYMSIRDDAAITMRERVIAAASLGLERLTEKLAETDSTELPLGELRNTTMALLDRAGHSPVNKTLQLSGALSAQDINDIKTLHGPGAAPGPAPTQGAAPAQLEAQAAGDLPADPVSGPDNEAGLGKGGAPGSEGPRLHVRTLRSEGASQEPALRPSLDDLDLDSV